MMRTLLFMMGAVLSVAAILDAGKEPNRRTSAVLLALLFVIVLLEVTR